MLAMTLEHLLSGAAAVEDESSTRSSSSNSSSPSCSPSGSQGASHSPSHSSASASASARGSDSGDDHSPRADSGRPLDREPHAKYLKTEHGAVPTGERELTPIQPMPKLPPISSLTQANGLPPSLQAHQAPAHAPRPPASAAGANDEALCRYRNKLCLNGRAVKRNGELHNLCEKHRAKANQNQRKLESKRRVQKRQTRHVPSAPPRTYQLTPLGAAVMPPGAMAASGMHHVATSQGMGSLPSLAQLHRPPPPPPSSSSSSYPYYDGNYPPYSREI